MECKFEGCDMTHWARGWCNTHYQQWRRSGKTWRIGSRGRRPNKKSRCTHDGCDRTHQARGWCAVHYGQWNRTGGTWSIGSKPKAPWPSERMAHEHIKDTLVRAPHPCTDCGIVYHYCQMHFDHLPGFEKESNVSRSRMAHLTAEMNVCEPVCANCHSIRTWRRANCIATPRPRLDLSATLEQGRPQLLSR